MKVKEFWGTARPTGVNKGVVVRMGLALFAILGSVALALVLLNGQHNARAFNAITETSTTQGPWGLAFDKSGNTWVAEPNCDPEPACAPPLLAGSLGQYKTADDSHVKDFIPSKAYVPTFVAVDGSGNIWFTDPSNNAIGELVPGSNTWTEFTAPTVNAQPYDLIFDGAGNLWFTERGTGHIGFYNPGTKTFQENAVTGGSTADLYGITYDAAKNIVWFAENAAAKVGSFTATANGILGGNAITLKGVANPTHQITIGNSDDVWYSEGNASQVGEIPGGTGTPKEFPVCAPPCSTFIGGIGVDSTNTVWFNDANNKRVGALTPATGQVVWTTPPNGNHPQDGLAVDSSNNVWFTDQYGHFLGVIPAGTQPTPTPSGTATGTPTGTPTPSPTPNPGGVPVSQTWYFAEGKVGGGFTEWLTIENPDPTNACNINFEYLLSNGSPVNVTQVAQPNSRFTESVNTDLNTLPGGSQQTDSAIVTVTNPGTCKGVVAERPMYFTNFFNGTSSGSDVLGATAPNTTFYFADMPTVTNTDSFITILNPGSTAANITATYYANGQVFGTPQTLLVNPGTRGTINPPASNTRVAAIVTSDQPVVVERPSYFSNFSAGNAGSVSGASSVIGAQALKSDWLFAEGYTGGGFQENFVIANLDPANVAANVTITLEYPSGTTSQFTLTVNPLSQVIWDVNANNHSGPSPNVSADISASGAGIVVEREEFFHYNNGHGLTSTGMTDITGLPASQASQAVSFAEGFTDTGYNEWLTLQNPTNAQETIQVTLVNGYGQSYTFQVSMAAHTRSTTDITALVHQFLYHSGDKVQAFEVSMFLQSNGNFVAERPMYFNASGSQGGSDVIGFVG